MKRIFLVCCLIVFTINLSAQSIQKGPAPSVANNANLSYWIKNLSEEYPDEHSGQSDYAAEIAINGSIIHTVWLSDSAYTKRFVFYRRSLDGGNNWETKKILFSDNFNNILSSAFYKKLAVDGNNVYVVVSGYGEGSTWFGKLTLIKSTDGGATFEEPKVIATEPGAWHLYDTKIVAINGKLYIGFRNQCNWQVNNSFTIKISTDGGNTFTDRTAYSITEGGGGWSVYDMIINGDDIHVMYLYHYYYYGLQEGRLYVATSHDDGLTFNSQMISVPSSNGVHKTYSPYDYHPKPKIVADGNNLYVIWTGYNAEDKHSVYFKRSTDRGDNFEDAINLTVAELGNLPIQAGQETIAAKGNYVYVIFLTTNGRLFLKRSSNAGASFENLQEITAPDGTKFLNSVWWPLVKIDPNDSSGKKVFIFNTVPKYLSSADGGATFDSPKLLGPYFSWRKADMPQFEIDEEGNLHYVVEGYCTWFSTGVFGDNDIFYQKIESQIAEPSEENYAIQFVTINNVGDGTGKERMDNMQIPASSDLNFTSAMTAEAWINVNRREGYDCYFIYKAETGVDGAWGPYILGQWRDGKLDARIATENGGFVLGGGDPIPNNTWVHVAMTYDANAGENNFKIYINGNEVGKQTATGNLITGQGSVFIGGDNYYRYIDGIIIDELRFWNRALTGDEIKANMYNKLTGKEAGLTAYYNFDKTTKDITGHGNDGYLMYKETYTPFVPTDIEGDNTSLPTEFVLFQNYPNPFNPSTVISYQLPVASHISLKLYDVLGKEIATLVNEEKLPGNYKVDFDASNLASGVYFYRLQAGDFVSTKKLMLIK